MKKLFIAFLIPLFSWGCAHKLSESQKAELWKALRQQNFFRLNNLVNNIQGGESDPDMLVFRAKLGYVFNQPRESNQAISAILEKYPREFNDTIVSDLYFIRAVNFTRMEEYRKASEAGSVFVEKYAGLYDSSFVAETKDDNKVREALWDAPKMDATKISDVQIPIKRDMAGLINLPVMLGADSVDFVFDSGANMSVIISSVAGKYGFKPLGKKINVMAITGKNIEADLALVNLKMGSITIRNSPFIIFPDSILTFAGGAYVIRGIIGYPIMNALKEFTVKNNKSLIIPKTPGKSNNRNFAMDQSNPVILVKYGSDTLPFHFDTGAESTLLYSPFYNKYQELITTHSKKTTDHVGGAGGEKEVEAYILGKAEFMAGENTAQLDSLRILTAPLMSNQKYFYGNLGQDFMKQFGVMTVNFESMNIRFSKQ